jgi:hypothetical protein
MFNSYRITVFTINHEGGEAEKTTRIEDEQTAVLKFHSECDKYGSNKQTAYCTVKLFDKSGGQIRTENFSQPMPEGE